MRDDAELLRCYAETRAEAAFAELVGRHVDFVYSAALRQVNGDTHLAEDVTQTVFADLARKSGRVANHRVLAGWLFTSTRFAAAKAVRGEQRRRARDREAQLMNEILREDPAEKREWARVRPVIDEVLSQLGEADREAVLLRFFEGRDFAVVGVKLRLTENAARMRVERALDKLHALLARRGVTSTTGALAAALSAQAVGAAPAGLAASVAVAAISGSTFSLGAGAVMTFMSMTKLQLGIAGAVALAGVTGIAIQENANAALRAEVAGLEQPVDLAALQAENLRLTRLNQEVAALKADDAEFARVSAEAAALKIQLEAQAQARSRLALQTRVGPVDSTDGSRWKPVVSQTITGEIYDISKLDRRPSAKFQAKPVYPFEMRKAEMEGDVLVDMVVGPEGNVLRVSVVKSSHREFEGSAVEAVSKWTFSPGQIGGQAVNAHLQVPIVFKISKGKETPATWF